MIQQITPQELEQWALQADPSQPALVLDVREAWEVQTARVQGTGFELVTIPMGDIPKRLGELDPGRAVACLCHHGARSQRVAAFLQAQGFSALANISGGIDAWSVTRDPSVPRY